MVNSSYIFTMISLGHFFFNLTVLGQPLVPTANLPLKYSCIFLRTVCGHIIPRRHCQEYFNFIIVADLTMKWCLHADLVCILWVPSEGEHSPVYFTGNKCFFLFELLLLFFCLYYSLIFLWLCSFMIIVIFADLKNL